MDFRYWCARTIFWRPHFILSFPTPTPHRRTTVPDDLERDPDRRVHQYFAQMVREASQLRRNLKVRRGVSPSPNNGGEPRMIAVLADGHDRAIYSRSRPLRVWMPQAGSLHAPAIDTLMRVSLLALTAAGILAQIILLAGLFLPREKRPRFSPAWRWIASAIFAACMVWMTVVAENLWSTIRLTHAAPTRFKWK